MDLPGPIATTHVIFGVHDMAAAITFYRDMGLEVESHDAGYAWVRHRGHEVFHLELVHHLDPTANHGAGYLHVRDADVWHAAWAGRPGVGDVDDRPWGMREFTVVDPSGNRLRVGANL